MYPLLQHINSPDDLRQLPAVKLHKLADEIRQYIQQETRAKAGHIRSSLGVVDLTIALHFIFHTPDDILIWDVGHQAYAHKIITGRRANFSTNRKLRGISGFTSRSESEYDPFGAGHSSTSISAAVGFATTARLRGIKRQHIAVIGDGAFTGGESFEALNYLGDKKLNVTIILNDNNSSIDENVGALGKYKSYMRLCRAFKIKYAGEVSGHNMKEMLWALEGLKSFDGPKLLRVITAKGKGWEEPKEEVKMARESFQNVFSKTLISLAEKNDKIIGITPAMLSGSGLDKFKEHFPERTFDTGITEQHSVTMAAAMAADGYIPFCHLYSTFAQRAYDQIIHDVALQELPVIFCLDRAGLVGEDGATHHGNFDTGFLNVIPNLTICAPIDGDALAYLIKEAINSKSPYVIRYPKGETIFKGEDWRDYDGRIRQLKKGKEKAVISYGAIGAQVEIALKDTDFAHYDLMYLKPLDEGSLRNIFNEFDKVITIEENALTGGLGEKLAHLSSKWNAKVKLGNLHLPDKFIEHGSKEELMALHKLDVSSIQEYIVNF